MSILETPEPRVPRITLSIVETAESLGISERQVRRLIDRGVIPTVRLGARRVVSVDALHRVIDQLGEARA
ncbi:MAG TPA: helix-turn-helix domain-containing protein [Gemmatimonadales bacterium]|jgi:excisionase family DNA binding protein